MVKLALKPIGSVKGGVGFANAVPKIQQIVSIFEYIALRGEFIKQSNECDIAGVNDFYLVPIGYTFFLTSASMASVIDSAGAESLYHVYLRTEQAGADAALLAYHLWRQTTNLPFNGFSQTLAPALPLIFNGGTQFYVYQQASMVKTDVTIQGYLIENTEIPQIY